MKITLAYTTFNRAKQLWNSLGRLEFVTKPDELIIVDDGSQDNTFDYITPQLKKLRELGVEIKYFYRDHPIYDVCSIPRNIAIKQASGDIFITSEPECLFVSDVIAEYLELMKKYPKHVITAGIVYFTNPGTEVTPELLIKNPQEQMKTWDIKPFPNGFYAHYPPQVVTKFEYPTAPFSGCYKKEWLEKVGGWDEDMAIQNGGGGYGFDDTDLLTRLREKGYNQVRENQIIIIHQWHQRPFGQNQHGNTADGWAINEQIMLKKRDDKYLLVANRDREWGSMERVKQYEI